MANNDIQNKVCPNKCYWINQGLIYGLLVLITMILTMFFINLVNVGVGAPSFVSKVEFGATLSSIILSVVAIVYTLIQSKQSESVTAKVVDASDMIEEHSKTLNKSVTVIENEINNLKEMNLDETLKKHMDKFDIKLKELGELTDGGFKKVSSDFNMFIKNGFLGGGNISGREDVNNINEETLKTIATNILLNGNSIRYQCYIVFKFYIANFNCKKNDELWFNLTTKLDENLKEVKGFNNFKQDQYIRVMCISLNSVFISLGFVNNNYECTVDIAEVIEKFREKEASMVESIDNVLKKYLMN